MTLHKPQGAQEQHEDLSSHTHGAYFFEIRHHCRKQITFQAYIRGTGIVTITNKGTYMDQFKLKDGNSLRLVPEDDVLYMTAETYAELGLPTDNARARRSESLRPIPSEVTETVVSEVAADVTGVYNRVSGEKVEEETPDSSQQAG